MRDIDPAKIEAEELDWFEWKYLKDRNRLPKGYPEPDPDDSAYDPEPEPPRSRVVPLEDQEQLEIEDTEEEAREILPSKVTPTEEQSQIEIGEPGGIVDDEEGEEDYLEGWNNDQRRAALQSRGLSVEGRKDDLIARLRRADANALLPEDAGQHEDDVEDDDTEG